MASDKQEADGCIETTVINQPYVNHNLGTVPVSIKESNMFAHLHNLIKVFVVHMKKLCILGYPKCAQ